MENKKKILLIEDELFINDLYSRSIAQDGFTILSAIDGVDGLEKAKLKPDLILLDIMLPKLNGLEVLARLKQDPTLKSIPVILLTNLGQEDVVTKAFKLGAQGYLMKMRVLPTDIVREIHKFLADPNQVMDLKSIDLE
jgi:CheY-like chemotaxis protein